MTLDEIPLSMIRTFQKLTRIGGEHWTECPKCGNAARCWDYEDMRRRRCWNRWFQHMECDYCGLCVNTLVESDLDVVVNFWW